MKTVEPVLIWRMDIIVNVQRDIPEEIVLKVIILNLQRASILMRQRFYGIDKSLIFAYSFLAFCPYERFM